MNINIFGSTMHFSIIQIIFTALFIIAIIVGAIGTSTRNKNKGQDENLRLAKEMEEEYRRQRLVQQDEEDLEQYMNNDFIG